MLFDKNLERLLFPLGIAVVSLFLLLSMRSILLRVFTRRAERTESTLDDSIIHLFRVPSIYWCLAIAIHVGINVAELSEKMAKPLVQAIEVLLILSVTLVTANVLVSVIRNLLLKNKEIQISGLAVWIVRAFVFVTGTLTILSVFGVSITPLLGALGVGGLAVALALKDTLENLFAGIYLIWDRTIRVGDYVRFDGATEGEVEDVGWRTTRIRNSGNSTVIVPNSKLAQSTLTNYCLPERKVTTTLTIYLNAQADLDKTEALMLEEARKGSEDIVGLLGNPAPNVRLGQPMVEGGLNITLNFHVREFKDQGFVLHELRRRIYRRFREAGILLFTKP